MNLDKNRLFPNQIFDMDFTECVGLTTSDIAGNIQGVPFSSDFSYAMTFQLQNLPPTTNGEDPEAGMDTGIAYGFLPQKETTFTAKTYGELYAANAANYTPMQKKSALQYALPGKTRILVSGDNFADIKAAVLAGQPVSMPMSWFQTFSGAGQDGILTTMLGEVTNHNVAVYDVVVDDGVERLLGKPWLGPGYGYGGYFKMDKTICNIVCRDAFVYTLTAKRWQSIVRILLQYRFPYLKDFTNQLLEI